MQAKPEDKPVPKDWRIVRLYDFARIRYGKARPKSEGKIPVIGSGGIYGWTDKPLVRKTTVIVGRKGTAGYAQLLLEPCWPSDTTFYLEFDGEELIPEFLFYFMGVKKLSGEHAKTTLPSLQRRDLENYLFPLPPKAEQRKIVFTLSKIQQAIEQQDKIIETTRNLKKSLMRKLFREGIGHTEFKDSEIGRIPKSWGVVSINDIKVGIKGAVVSGPFGSNIGKRFFVDRGVPVIRGNNLTGSGEKRFIDEGFVFVTEQKAEELKSCTAIPNDLIFTAAGTLGQVGLIPEDCRYPKYIISNKQLRARVDEHKALPLFLFYWFSSPLVKMLINHRKTGTSIPVINLSVLRSLPVILPSLTEQRQLVSILQSVDKKIKAEEKRKSILQQLFKTTLHKLMCGEIRVKDLEVPAHV
ncbi:MAG: restriction endonuclease subunit S [Thaumarchaeota archaeon]|nr:restriction endonuclease subunit S [Nitrososphaerota archaeon]